MKKEVELRASLSPQDVTRVEAALSNLKLSPLKSEQDDTYYCPQELINEGRSKEAPFVVRIRNKNKQFILTYKSFTENKSSWIEEESKVDDGESVARILGYLGLSPYLKINKTRSSYKHGKFEINVDEIQDLGVFVEMEVVAINEVLAKTEIEEFMKNILGISTTAIITEGYVQLMEKKLHD